MARLKRLIIPALLAAAFGPAHAEPVTAVISSIASWLGTVGYAGITYGTYAAVAFSAVATAHANSQAKRRAHQEASSKLAQDIANISDRTATRLQSDAPHVTIYGEPGRVGVNLLGEFTTGMGAQWNHAILAVASHECDAITEVFVEDDPVQADENGNTTNEALIKTASAQNDFDFGPAVHIGIHLSPGGVDVADQWLIDKCNGPYGAPGMWTADHKISGVTYFIFSYNRTLERFNAGLPKITVTVRGKKLYDPRTGQTVYSRNPALAEADFLRSEAGYSATAEQIDTDSLVAAANACDEAFYSDVDAFNHGNSVARYTCDGVFTSDQDRDTTRQQIEDCMAGMSVQAAGVWRILAGAWSTPVLTLTDADMLQPAVVVQTVHPTHRRYNSARGTHVNASGNGVSSDFTPYSNAAFLASDGRPKVLDLVLPFVSSQTRCHQLARIAVERSRGGLTLRIQPKMLAWFLQPGDRIVYSNELLGIVGKTFIVTDWSHSHRGGLGLQIEEDIPEFYDLVDETRSDPTPNTNLPNPFTPLAAPTGLTVVGEKALQGASTILRARVSWDRAFDGRVLLGGAVRVQWRPGETDPAAPETGEPWQTADLPGESTEQEIVGLSIEQPYTVRVQFATIYVRGAWAWAGQVFTSEPPTEVDGLALAVEQDGIYARWSPPEGIDLAEWDRTQVGRGPTIEDAAADIRFDGHATGANLGWFPAGDQLVWAVHHSRAGLWSEPVNAGISIEPPATPAITARLQGRTVQLEWQDCSTTQPVREYILALGSSAETAVEIGRYAGTNAQRVEATADLVYQYWVQAVDMAGNVSEWAGRSVIVLPDFSDPTDLEAYKDRVWDLVDRLRDELAALQLRGAVQADGAIARAREKFGNDLTKVGTVIDQVRSEVGTATEATATRIDTVAAQFETSIATVEDFVTAVATEQSATATALQTLAVEVDDNAAHFTSEISVLVDDTQATASQLITLSSDFQGNKATVVSQIQTVSTAQSAQATLITGISTTVNDNHSAVTLSISSLTTEQSAQATHIVAVESAANRAVSYRQASPPTGTIRVGALWSDTDDNNRLYRWSGTGWVEVTDPRTAQNTAAIVTEQTTRADAVSAQAQRIDSLITRVDDVEASYVTETNVTSTVNAAIVSNNTFLESAIIGYVDGELVPISAQLSTQQTTVATLDGNLAAQHLLKAELVGSTGKRALAGIKVGVSSTNGGVDVQSEVAVLAGSFMVGNRLTPGGALVPVFKVEGDAVYMDTARIKNADIGTLKLAGRAVVQPMVTNGPAGTAALSFQVPAGQNWDCVVIAGFRTITGSHITGSHSRAVSISIAGGGSVSDTIYPVITNVVEGESGSTFTFALPSATLTGGGTLPPGNYTITATSSVLGSVQGGVDLSLIVGKAGV